MACGAPVVCGNRSSLPEVAGDAAFLCNPLQAVDITLALNRVMDDAALRFTLQQRALERAAQFTWEQTAQLTRHVYKRALAG
jgi:alpha-1,3-rhamnosyl/mannosyltransferase